MTTIVDPFEKPVVVVERSLLMWCEFLWVVLCANCHNAETYYGCCPHKLHEVP
jgi:hypothetical protein